MCVCVCQCKDTSVTLYNINIAYSAGFQHNSVKHAAHLMCHSDVGLHLSMQTTNVSTHYALSVLKVTTSAYILWSCALVDHHRSGCKTNAARFLKLHVTS